MRSGKHQNPANFSTSIPRLNHNQTGFVSFFCLRLGLNSLPGSCVHWQFFSSWIGILTEKQQFPNGKLWKWITQPCTFTAFLIFVRGLRICCKFLTVKWWITRVVQCINDFAVHGLEWQLIKFGVFK